MKNSPNNHVWGIVALFSAGFLGGFAALAAKIILRELPPITTLFLRLTIMTLVLVPFVLNKIDHLMEHWKKLLVLSVLLMSNLAFFIVGIKYTTAIVSGLLYASTPIFVALENYLFYHTKANRKQAVGILFGFTGAVLIIFQSFAPQQGLGTFFGTLLIFVAVISYSLYLVYSKHISIHISPLGLTASVSLIGWVIVGILMLYIDGFAGLQKVSVLSPHAWIALIFLGTGMGVIMYSLNQWGIKHGTALAASVSLYVGTITTTATGVLFLSETLTPFIIIGGIMLLVGVYISTILPLQLERKKSAK